MSATASMQKAVLVHLTHDGERDVGAKFLQWCMDEKVYALEGVGCGPRWVRGSFSPADAEKIAEWFMQNAVEVKKP